jgi:hypothetical protein
VTAPASMPKPTLARLFEGLQRKLESELGVARDVITHAGTKGAASEDRWIDALSRHLPERYRVGRAFVVDSRDGCSEQIDIVAYDRQYSPFVLNLDGATYVPAESVYAVLEVKQTLSAEHIEYAAAKVDSVRRLHRTSIPIRHAGGEFPAKPLHHILGGIVALESSWTPPFDEPLARALQATSPVGQLDIGCAVRHGYFHAEYSSDRAAVVTTEQSSVSLALFLFRLVAALQCIATVPCIDVLSYAAAARR